MTTKVCKYGYPKPLVEFSNDDKDRYPETPPAPHFDVVRSCFDCQQC